MTATVTIAMVEFFRDIRFVEHALKVCAYARCIAKSEGVAPDLLELLACTALLHDIGIPDALRKHGSAAGPHQEKEGGPIAEAMLLTAGFPKTAAARGRFLVEHHHSPAFAEQDSLLQILIEADFLVNLAEENLPDTSAHKVFTTYFHTETGKVLLRTLFLDEA